MCAYIISTIYSMYITIVVIVLRLHLISYISYTTCDLFDKIYVHLFSWHGIVQEVTWDLEWVEVTEHA